MINVSIMGATGYAGVELVRLLLTHPVAKLSHLSSVSFEGKPISEIYPALHGICDERLTGEDGLYEDTDVLFTSLPAGLSEPVAKKCAEKGILLIDLGADFRLTDPAAYEKWYGRAYSEPALHEKAAYCIPELHSERLKTAKIIGNPGCYPTSIALAIAPALQGGLIETKGIVIDSKSGVTGAGRGLTQTSHFPDCNEAFSPYKVASHRHTPEIEQTLSELAGAPLTVTFVPHLLPLNRGILSTLYTELKAPQQLPALVESWKSFYADKPFVRVLEAGETANLRNVKYSNYCDISLHLDSRTGRLILVSAIDNMVKGAAGQAIQNMNIAMGLPETEGLMMVPPAF